MNRYFISYAHSCGFGCSCIDINRYIEDMNDISYVIDKLQNKDPGIKDIVILNIQKLPI